MTAFPEGDLNLANIVVWRDPLDASLSPGSNDMLEPVWIHPIHERDHHLQRCSYLIVFYALPELSKIPLVEAIRIGQILEVLQTREDAAADPRSCRPARGIVLLGVRFPGEERPLTRGEERIVGRVGHMMQNLQRSYKTFALQG